MTLGRLLRLVSLAVVDVSKQSIGLAPLYRPATSDPGKSGILSTPGAQQGMESLAKDPSCVLI